MKRKMGQSGESKVTGVAKTTNEAGMSFGINRNIAGPSLFPFVAFHLIVPMRSTLCSG